LLVMSLEAMCLMRLVVSFSTFLMSCECCVEYITHTELSVHLRTSFPSECLYFMTNRHFDGSSKYNT